MSSGEQPTDVRTVGVDIAKDEATTAVCTIHWTPGVAVVGKPVMPADDEVVLAAARADGVVVVAFDAPFGWPAAMVAAVSSWRPGGRWTGLKDYEFRLRRADVVTKALTLAAVGVRRQALIAEQKSAEPLSVSADKIAMAAWRCCGLLDALANGDDARDVVTDTMGRPFPNDGRGRIVEAYPAAALAMWGIAREGYKKTNDAARVRRLSMLDAIERGGEPGWIKWDDNARVTYAATDHALDAFVCALVARAAMLGLVHTVPDADHSSARAEGWIALPFDDSFRALSTRGAPRLPT